MRDYVIMTDSCCDLNAYMAQQMDLYVLPLMLHMDGKDYPNMLDGSGISFEEFYRKMRSGMLATTSAVNVGQFEDAMRAVLAQGKDIVCSAASILFYTACETVNMVGDEAFEDKPTFNINDSDNGVTAYIKCNPKEDFTAILDTIYQTIYNGYKLLAEGYPNNVSLTVE